MTSSVKEATKVGSIVKVERNGEKFWCKVTRVFKIIIHGRVVNHLVNSKKKVGDRVYFTIKDIREVYAL
jgi:hypothetical protein